MFDLLKKRLEEEHAQRVENTKSFIQNGYCESWSDEHKTRSDRGIERESTPLRWKQYKNGEINREKAVELATKRALKDAEKTLLKDLERLTNAENAEDVTSVSVSVEWKKIAFGDIIPQQRLRLTIITASNTRGPRAAADMTN